MTLFFKLCWPQLQAHDVKLYAEKTFEINKLNQSTVPFSKFRATTVALLIIARSFVPLQLFPVV